MSVRPTTDPVPAASATPFASHALAGAAGPSLIPADDLVTLGDAVRMYRREMHLRAFSFRTQDRYASQLQKFVEHLGGGHMPVRSVTREHCREFLLASFPPETHEASTLNLAHTILSSFFKHLVEEDVLDLSPMAKVKKAKAVPLRYRKRTRITTAQLEQMLGACESWTETLALNTIAHTGLRRHALAMARWGDVDGKARTLRVREKGAKVRDIPIPTALWRLFTRYWIECGPFAEADYVIPNEGSRRCSGPRSDRLVYDAVVRIAQRCGVKAHAHSIRAAFAMRFLEERPGELLTLSGLMGHASVDTTAQSYVTEFAERNAAAAVIDLEYQGVPA